VSAAPLRDDNPTIARARDDRVALSATWSAPFLKAAQGRNAGWSAHETRAMYGMLDGGGASAGFHRPCAPVTIPAPTPWVYTS